MAGASFELNEFYNYSTTLSYYITLIVWTHLTLEWRTLRHEPSADVMNNAGITKM